MSRENTSINLALTMGDPAGIGPEIAVKALSQNNLPEKCRIFIIGDISVLEQTAKQIYSTGHKPFHIMENSDDFKINSINVLDINIITPSDFTIGKVNKSCGKAAYAYILKSINLAKKNAIDAIITNPINKTSLKTAGINFPGHTEILATETNTKKYSMIFMLDNLCVAHVTTHCSLLDAIKNITKENVFSHISLLNNTLESLGFHTPAIGVGGLNPHAGENGLFGNEEILHIRPAIEKAISYGINTKGPLPPDTIFMRAFNGEFNGVVSMLHDHGFVALKTRDFKHGVNITAGLPIVRTSVGHGTAFDIAGKGTASEENLISAIKAAYSLVAAKR